MKYLCERHADEVVAHLAANGGRARKGDVAKALGLSPNQAQEAVRWGHNHGLLWATNGEVGLAERAPGRGGPAGRR